MTRNEHIPPHISLALFVYLPVSLSFFLSPIPPLSLSLIFIFPFLPTVEIACIDLKYTWSLTIRDSVFQEKDSECHFHEGREYKPFRPTLLSEFARGRLRVKLLKNLKGNH